MTAIHLQPTTSCIWYAVGPQNICVCTVCCVYISIKVRMLYWSFKYVYSRTTLPGAMGNAFRICSARWWPPAHLYRPWTIRPLFHIACDMTGYRPGSNEVNNNRKLCLDLNFPKTYTGAGCSLERTQRRRKSASISTNILKSIRTYPRSQWTCVNT